MSTPDPHTNIERFAEIYGGLVKLQAAETALSAIPTANNVLQDTFRQGIEVTNELLAELAQDSEVRDYYTGLGKGVLTAAADIERSAPVLKGLGFGEVLERERDTFWAMGRGPEGVKNLAAVYFVRRFVQPPEADTESNAIDFDAEPPLVVTETLDVTGESDSGESGFKIVERPLGDTGDMASDHEDDPNVVKILLDNKGHVVLGGNVVSLRRKVEVAQKNEQEITNNRLNIIKFLAEHPDETFSSTQLKKAVGIELDAGVWQEWYVDFLRDELLLDGQPLVTVDKSTPKRTYFKLEKQVQFVDSEESFVADDEGVFILPNGKAIGGKTAAVLHAMHQSSKDKPLVADDLLRLNIYTPEELGANAYSVTERSALTSIVSCARKFIIGSSYRIVKVLTGEANSKTNRKYPGYYLVDNSEVETVLSNSNEDVSPNVEPIVEQFTVKEAAIIATYLKLREDELKSREIPELPTELAERLQAAVTTGNIDVVPTDEEIVELRQSALEKILAIFSDDDRLLQLLEETDKDDPVMPLIEYISDLFTRFPGATESLAEVFGADFKQFITVDTARRAGWRVEDISTSAQRETTSRGGGSSRSRRRSRGRRR